MYCNPGFIQSVKNAKQNAKTKSVGFEENIFGEILPKLFHGVLVVIKYVKNTKKI